MTLKWILALPVLLLMIGFSKIAQYYAVEAFGAQLGFEFASVVGLAPVLAFYYWAAIKLPRFAKLRQTNG